MEQWKDIEGFEGYYQVSNIGRIRSLDREVRHSKNGTLTLKGKVLKGVMDKDGYLLVHLSKEGKKKMFKVHRLVYSAFNGEIPSRMQVNHIDEDKMNNKLENLNLMTCKENINFGTRTERAAKTNTNNPLRSKPVIALNADSKIVFEFPSTKEAGRQGFDQSHLSKCCRGEQKTHRGYRWKYKEEA